MSRTVYTAGDISRLADERVSSLRLRSGDVITPLARDEAKRLGVSIDEATDATPTAARGSGDDLESAVRRIVTGLVTADQPPRPPGPVRRVEGRGLALQPFPFDVGRPEMDVRLRDVITAQEHDAPVAAGFMSLREGSFPWTLDYAEIDYVIEGELHLGTERGEVVGLPGDVLYIPKGTSLTFGTPSWARFLYVTYPAEWSAQGSNP